MTFGAGRTWPSIMRIRDEDVCSCQHYKRSATTSVLLHLSKHFSIARFIVRRSFLVCFSFWIPKAIWSRRTLSLQFWENFHLRIISRSVNKPNNSLGSWYLWRNLKRSNKSFVDNKKCLTFPLCVAYHLHLILLWSSASSGCDGLWYDLNAASRFARIERFSKRSFHPDQFSANSSKSPPFRGDMFINDFSAANMFKKEDV